MILGFIFISFVLYAGGDIGENDIDFQGELTLDSSNTVQAGPRDPFYRVLVGYIPDNPLNSYKISEIELRGVLWDNPQKVALFITPNGKRYFLGVGQLIGAEGGKISDIKEGKVIITLEDSTIIIKKVPRRS